MIVQFPGKERTTRTEVGGKATSLIRMSEAGLPVPPGAVLTSTFFAPWIEETKASAAWAELIEAAPDHWAPFCSELQRGAKALSLTVEQRDALHVMVRQLVAASDEARLAVRSSSPEEDLASASFAGLYATRLGVGPDDMEDAVRDCFASSLNLRVLTYKKEHGFDLWAPRFAVIVQRQIDSEVAGVGFSLNPVTNDYDEAVISANWGLGTSVVEGLVTPDHFVVNKVERQVVEETRGAKHLSIWLEPDGGTVERRSYRSAERALTDSQLHELSGMIGRIEALFNAPVDVEWAYAGTKLHVLQARPITAYVPLPPGMITPPGERRRIYMDASLSKGLTMNRPASSLGLDLVERMFSAIIGSWVGPLEHDVPAGEALHIFSGGRMYMNLSILMWFVTPKMMSKGAAPTDTLMAEILAGIDAKRYRAVSRPSWVSFRLLRLIPRVVWSLCGFFWNVLQTITFPESMHRTYQRRVAALESELRESFKEDLPLDSLRRASEVRLAREFNTMMSVLTVGMVSPDLVLRRKAAGVRALADKLKRGVTGNLVIEMGIALHRLAKLLDGSEFQDLPRLTEAINHRRLPPDFLSAWDDFLARFGCRGPLEMDVASPRYSDDPRLALRQMSFMAVDDGFDPEAAHRRHVEERQGAYEELMRGSGPVRRVLLRRICRLNNLFAGSRDTPKHLIVLFNCAIRKRALIEGWRLAWEGRLDGTEHVFDLTFDDLRVAAEERTLDLRKVREERIRFREKLLDAHVMSFPPVIDSRGRILRPPPTKDAPGLLSGMPVSPGVATGPAKVSTRPTRNPRRKATCSSRIPPTPAGPRCS